MDISRALIKEFAKVTNDAPKTEDKTSVYGTVSVMNGKKYVKIDGSSILTPMSETIEAETGDRVLVTIAEHSATVIGNFTYPPSARKTNEAKEKAEEAETKAGEAQTKAEEAHTIADNANVIADTAKTTAEEAQAQADAANRASELAKEAADDANVAAYNADAKATEAKQNSDKAIADSIAAMNAASTAQATANNAITASESAQAKANQAEVKADEAKSNITTIRDDLNQTNSDIETLSENLETVSNTMVANYARKTDLTDTTTNLQTQINQNAAEITSTASRLTEVDDRFSEEAAKALAQANKAQADALAAKEQADTAISNAATAKQSADEAQAKAISAQSNATQAQTAANNAQSIADQAQAELNTAKANLDAVASRVDSTEEDIALATAAVATAQTAANNASNAAATAQSTANTAKTNAATAQTAANNAANAANAAQQSANDALDAASEAQAGVDALSVRVTSAETKITQNSEAITLAATKEEVTTRLNGYYTKQQADAAIKVSADAVTTSVMEEIEVTNDTLGTLTNRVSSAEQKITSDAIVSTVRGSTSYKTDLNAKASQSSLDATNSNVAGVDGKVNSLTTRVSTAESSITQQSNQIALKVEQTHIDSAVNNIQIGGKNLLLNSGFPVTNNSNPLQIYRLSGTPTLGKVHTISLKGTLGSGKTGFGIYNSGGTVLLTTLTPSDKGSDGIFRKTFVWNNTSGSNTATDTTLNVYALPNNIISNSTIDWIKLEEGNKSILGWTAAPEDIDAALSALVSRVNAAELKIEDTAIVATVTSSTIFNTVKNNASTAKTTADEAKTQASSAETKANTAKTTAESASGTANTAKATADNASTTANTAKNTADNASSTANEAKAKAYEVAEEVDNIEGEMEALEVRVNAAELKIEDSSIIATVTSSTTFTTVQTNAETAKSTADAAKTQASSAETKANTANTNASNAVSTANTAKSTADTAKSTAESAVTTANTAKSTADSAASNASSAINSINDMSSDEKVTPIEKISIKKEWDIIVAEKIKIDSSADTHGITTEKTAYGTAYSALNTYISPLLTNMTTTSALTKETGDATGGTTFRKKFKNYYDARQALLNAIAAKAKTTADAAVSTANTASTNASNAVTTANTANSTANTASTNASNAVTAANTASTNASNAVSTANTASTNASNAVSTANTAKTTADTANSTLTDMASDEKVTPVEKISLKKEWDIIVSEKVQIDAAADLHVITTEKTTYGTAYSALSTYITPLFTSMTTISTLTKETGDTTGGATLRKKFKNYYDAKIKLLNLLPGKLLSRVSTAEQKITADAITSTVRAHATYQNDLTGKVSTNEIISKINQTAESVTIQASKIGILGATNIPDLTANKIKGGTLTLGGSNIETQNGVISVKNASDVEIFRSDKDGTRIKGGTFAVSDNTTTGWFREGDYITNIVGSSSVLNAQKIVFGTNTQDGRYLKDATFDKYGYKASGTLTWLYNHIIGMDGDGFLTIADTYRNQINFGLNGSLGVFHSEGLSINGDLFIRGERVSIKSLKGNTDNRNYSPKPYDCYGRFTVEGLKSSSYMGLNDQYSWVFSGSPWADSSGGKAHLIALNAFGIYHTISADDNSWNGWKRISYDNERAVIWSGNLGVGSSFYTNEGVDSFRFLIAIIGDGSSWWGISLIGTYTPELNEIHLSNLVNNASGGVRYHVALQKNTYTNYFTINAVASSIGGARLMRLIGVR